MGILKNEELHPEVWRNGGWQELHIETNPIKIKSIELDNDQRVFYIDTKNSPPWARPIVEYINDNFGEIVRK
ncbi:hypothetical protein MBCUT_10230 [Methanobrevibacter cuticularis]|uniref:Uncharacterized protein n=1 Tax=Methanobrevibacter cuticularis TaxID=47311 RepID=A0A166CQY8_9EURY|nr:hypothetical protein [Methanobrevibacter cuticularis]KZX16157.1 hypothetical protein MBCUT_10230 [Methanobrevibacter cuticularis]